MSARRVDVHALFGLVRPYRNTLIAATIALLIGTGMSLVYPQIVRVLVDGALSEGGSTAELNKIILLLLVVFAIQSVFTFARSYLFTVVGERVVADLRRRLYDALIMQEIGFYDERRTGELTNRLSSDTTVLQNTVTANISMALRFGLQGIGGLGIMVWTSPRLTAVMMAVVPVVAISGAVYGRAIRNLSRDVQDALARSTEVAEETFSGIRTVRAFAREQGEQERYGEAVEGSYDLAVKRSRATALFGAAISFGGYAAIALVIWYGGMLVLDGRLSGGTLTAFLLYTFIVAFSLATLSNLYGDFMKAIGASERVFELLGRVPRVGPPAHPKILPEVRGEVRLEDVDFHYPARPEATVLKDVSLIVRPGEKVALVGPSGSGKSTIAALILRFYDPIAGVVRLDGESLADLDPSWLRRQIGSVSQEPVLFATSIAENIRYGRPEASDAEVEAAARAANAHDFVSSFSEGYQTLVGERGVKLSGGQKQRIAIARAVLRDPRVLLLDEATSALDAESEHLVQEALERLMEGRTTVIIAHRLSTVVGADRIVVIEAGRVVQEGSHVDLMQAGGLYRKLVERQFATDAA